MTSSQASSIITPIGIFLVLHSAYSTLQYRSILTNSPIIDYDLLHAKGFSPTSPPIDVIMESMLGFILCLLGSLHKMGEFIPITSNSGGGNTNGTGGNVLKSKKLKASLHESRDFDLFCTRAKYLGKK